MAFALAHAKSQDLRRVIVVIPYLSIIEQNAREYRSVLGPENVVEHHSAVSEQEAGTSGHEPHRRSPSDLATENWDSPIIVTTSVQFLESLLEASPRRCRKLHNVARSVIIFDEAQALPTRILNPLVSVFRELVETFGCSIVFSTATQPAFRRGTGLTEGLEPDELKPILTLDLVAESFRSLQRVEYRPEFDATWDWDTLVGRLIDGEFTQGLCVLNTRRHAREVWEKLQEKLTDRAAIFHLSSAMCAEHRIAVLGDPANPASGSVRYRLKHGLPCWLVSTQVIEAGVDVDFPRVFRALGPLDSIVQAAGRCNREGKLKRGEVVVFQPADPGIPRGFYQMAAGEARTFLGEYTGEELATDPAIFARYFNIIYGRADCDSHGIQPLRAAFQFREVAGLARVIEDGGTPVIVSYGPSPGLINEIRRLGNFDRAALRRLQRFTVNLRRTDWLELERRTAVEPLLPSCPEGPHILHPAAYHDRLGVVIADRAADDFII
jgi:CRISPR-associated endonuclease/helicase Cas3